MCFYGFRHVRHLASHVRFPRTGSGFRPSSQQRAACHRRSPLSKVGMFVPICFICSFGQRDRPHVVVALLLSNVVTVLCIPPNLGPVLVGMSLNSGPKGFSVLEFAVPLRGGIFLIFRTISPYSPDVIPALRRSRSNSPMVSDPTALTRVFPSRGIRLVSSPI